MGELIYRFLKLEPGLIRGILITAAGVIAAVLGRTVVDDSTVDLIVDLFTAVSALIAVVWVRGAVTANVKVVVSNDTPFEPEATLVSGDSNVATTTQAGKTELLDAAAGGVNGNESHPG